MKQALALRVLSAIMKWDTVRAPQEFAWLKLMSRLKYDSYGDFRAGLRFIESLASWIQQFDVTDREFAYQFIRNHLTYISDAEMNHLVEFMYLDTIQPQLLKAVANHLSIPTYRVWSQPDANQSYAQLLRKTLFLGLSDGARMDDFRRANTGIISNEQVVVATQISQSKWDKLLNKLRTDLNDPSARFAIVFLMDDFVGTGKTLAREDEGEWKGKLPRFWDDIKSVIDTHFDINWVLNIHHYVATYDASQKLPERQEALLKQKGQSNWFERVEFSFGMILPKDLPINDQRNSELTQFLRKYYDPYIRTKHTDVGGTDICLGFGECGLPIVFEHNTPNNSVALLWAESSGSNEHHAMRPLFRRKERHQ